MAQAAESSHVNVAHASVLQRLRQGIRVELRVVPRARDSTHVRHFTHANPCRANEWLVVQGRKELLFYRGMPLFKAYRLAPPMPSC